MTRCVRHSLNECRFKWGEREKGAKRFGLVCHELLASRSGPFRAALLESMTGLTRRSMVLAKPQDLLFPKSQTYHSIYLFLALCVPKNDVLNDQQNQQKKKHQPPFWTVTVRHVPHGSLNNHLRHFYFFVVSRRLQKCPLPSAKWQVLFGVFFSFRLFCRFFIAF